MRPTTVFCMLLLGLCCTAANAMPTDDPREQLDRGIVARATGDGNVYIGWRLLQSDHEDLAFDVYRRTGDAEPVKLNSQPVSKTTDFVDATAKKGRQHAWFIRPVLDGVTGPPSRDATLTDAEATDYVSIRLDGGDSNEQYTFQKIGIADLDGDRRFDYVIKQPNFNTDPYYKPGYWKKSPGTYKLEAYRHDGKLLWRHDLGWSIEQGIWYSPYVVYDLDGDGCAEVAVKTGEGDPRDETGRVLSGPEYLTILDGRSGKPIARLDWPSRDGFEKDRTELAAYNYYCRNQLCVAYLDGRTPSLIVQRGTYNVMKTVAYDLREGKLTRRWQWDNRNAPKEYWGQGAHWMHAADVDEDGREEVLLGSITLDDDGKPLWATGLGHPDHFYVGDIDPSRPGLEIYFGIESRKAERNGMCLVDASNGQILWGHEGPTRHVHSKGMCSDVDARHPGVECYSADTDAQKKFAWSKLRTCRGEVIDEANLGGFGALTAYWDADPQRELILDGRITNYPGRETSTRIEGRVVAVADVLGDWREEIITSVAGELRIYTTTIPAAARRTCLMQDPIYRCDVISAATGYFQVPMTGGERGVGSGE
ncbi:MAG: silent information regulator protein Sir2 [Candidatus Nealsonbacteria bacterium]|nr:silent information regulator protein Sir2 [Candidatus Nealsonbacteria bacterium]